MEASTVRRRPASRPPRRDVATGEVRCTTCGHLLSRLRDAKLLVRVKNRTLVVKPDGRVETNCDHCGGPTLLPLVFEGSPG